MRGQFKAVVALLTGYLAWNIAAWALHEPTDTWDTYRYFSTILDPFNPGVTTTAVYSLLQSRELITLVQVLLAFGAWSALAIAILVRTSFRWPGWVAAILVLLISMTAGLWNWNMLLNTESLTVTTVVTWLASIVWLTDATSRVGRIWPVLATSTVVAGFVGVTRPQLLVIVAPIQVLLVLRTARVRHRPGLATWSILGFLPFFGWALWRVWQLQQVDLYMYRYAINNLIGKNPSFRVYALERMPPCEAVPAALNGPAPWNDMQALGEKLMNVCPETWMWFRSPAVDMQQWMLAMPAETAYNFVAVMPGLVVPFLGELHAMPDWLSLAVMNRNYPWLWALGYLAIGIGIAWTLKVRIRWTPWTLLAGFISASSVLAYLVVVWAADGYDVERHVFPLLPLAAVAALALPSTLPIGAQRKAGADSLLRSDGVARG